MAKMNFYSDIPVSFFPAVLHKHSGKKIEFSADFKVTIPIEQIPFNIECFTEKNDEYALYFETGDIKKDLEAVTDSFFSTLYPDSKITIGAHFDENGRFFFDFHMYSHRVIFHSSDIELSVAEMEYVYRALEQYAEEHNITLPGQQLTWRERLSGELNEVLEAYIEEIPSDVLSMMADMVRDDVLDYLEDDEEQRKTDRMNGELAAKYFWKAIRKKLAAQ